MLMMLKSGDLLNTGVNEVSDENDIKKVYFNAPSDFWRGIFVDL